MIVLGIVFACCSLWALLLTRRLAPALTMSAWLAISGAVVMIALCWLPFGVARVVGMPTSPIAVLVSTASLLALEIALRPGALTAIRSHLFSWLSVRFCRGQRFVTLGGLSFLLAHAAGHYWHCLRESGGSYWSAGAAWEDQSFHAALATSFAWGDNLTRLSYPHLPDWPLGYPFLPDFQAGWLHMGGFSLPWAFWIGNVLASAVFLLAAAWLLKGWLQSPKLVLLALLIWHLGGGFGIAYVVPEWSDTGSLWAALQQHDYANDWGLELSFHNLTTAVVWPMRVVLFGMAAATAITVLLRSLLVTAERALSGYLLAGMLAGCLPLISAHALVVLACIIPPLAFFYRTSISLRGWCGAVLIGTVFTLPQLMWIRQQLIQSDPPFLRFSPGWTAGWWGETRLYDLLTHWSWNTGVWITLGFVGTLAAGRHVRRETLGWWLLFPLGYLFAFQPFVFDNLKLFAAAALAAAAGCATLLDRAWTDRRLGSRGLALLLFILMTASGTQSVVSEVMKPAIIADLSSRTFAEGIRQHTPSDALLLTGAHLHHPAAILAGRRSVATNPSGLTLHGVPAMEERSEEVRRIYENAPDALPLLHLLRPGWIVVGPMERLAYPNLNEAFLDRISEPVFNHDDWTLRKIRPEVFDER